jgi:hypothetical protein
MLSAPAKSQTSRVNVILPTPMLAQLRTKANRESITVTELLRYAIGLSEYVDDARAKGAKFYMHWPDGAQTELLPRFTVSPTSEA